MSLTPFDTAAPAPPSPVLEVSRLCVRRGGEVALADVDLRVDAGTIHVLLGPNGAGKSTLLAAAIGLLPFEGQIHVHSRVSGRVAFVPQRFEGEAALTVTVAEFLALERQRRPLCLGLAKATRSRVEALLASVGLGGFGPRLLSELSGGELRRVLLAHAVDPLPELLLLDEPAAGLDPPSQERLESTLKELRSQGVAILLVAHDLEQARRLGDRATVLDRRVVRSGPAASTLAGGEA